MWAPKTPGTGCYVAISNFVPALGTAKTAGVMQPFCPHVGPNDGKGYVAASDFVPILGGPKAAGTMATLPKCGTPRR